MYLLPDAVTQRKINSHIFLSYEVSQRYDLSIGTAPIRSIPKEQEMLSEQNEAVREQSQHGAPIEAPGVMGEAEFCAAVMQLNQSERMEFLRCLNATH
jgi:hypothetical protein